MYTVAYSLEDVSKWDTFEEAFVDLYKRLMKDMKKQGMSYQFLETAVWIECPGRDLPMLFYEARDKACDLGVLIDGKLNPEYDKPLMTEE